MDTVRYLFMKEGGFPRIFQEESTLHGNNYYEKEEGRPYSFYTFHTAFFIDLYCIYTLTPSQKIRETDTIGVDLQKVSVSTTNPPQLCLWIRLKESTHWVYSFSHFFVLNTGSALTIRKKKFERIVWDFLHLLVIVSHHLFSTGSPSIVWYGNRKRIYYSWLKVSGSASKNVLEP